MVVGSSIAASARERAETRTRSATSGRTARVALRPIVRLLLAALELSADALFDGLAPD